MLKIDLFLLQHIDGRFSEVLDDDRILLFHVRLNALSTDSSISVYIEFWQVRQPDVATPKVATPSARRSLK